ncbi:GGDEF domain-containing protein [Acetobacterium bakii]|nr:GGDEF domain-containing protein [Acetobacterium bakii]
MFSLRNHRTKSMVHGFTAAAFYIIVGCVFNHSFSINIIFFQAALILGFSLFVAEVNHLMNDVYERNRYAMVEIEYKNQLLEYRATTDFLTDLSNHQAFYQSLAFIATKQAPIALILFDIDDFKAVNDKYGHLYGDYVLREVAQIIKKHLRTSDIAARYGGEEFAVLLPGTEELFGQMIAERICIAIAQYQFEFEGQCMGITVSAGVSNSTVTLDRIEQTLLVDRADELLYCSKRNGKNQVTSARFK